MERHLDESFTLRFPRGDAPTLLRSRYLHRTVQATRLYPGLHEEVLSISGGDDLLAVRLHRTWDGTAGPVEVDVHIVFEHDDGPSGARLLTGLGVSRPRAPRRGSGVIGDQRGQGVGHRRIGGGRHQDELVHADLGHGLDVGPNGVDSRQVGLPGETERHPPAQHAEVVVEVAAERGQVVASRRPSRRSPSPGVVGPDPLRPTIPGPARWPPAPRPRPRSPRSR